MQSINPSLWVTTTPAGDFPVLNHDLSADVAIVGAGITGLSAALMLSRQGAKVIVIEAGAIAAGTTGYTTAKLTSLHGLTYTSIFKDHGPDRARQYADASQWALGWVAELVEQNRIECDFRRAAAFTYTRDESRVGDIEQEVKTAQSLGLPASLETQSDLPFDIKAAVRFDHQAMFHPRKYCLALASLAVAEGAQIFQMTRATRIDSARPCTVETPNATITAAHVIQATQIPVHDPGGFFARTSPTRSYCVAVPAGENAPAGMYLSVDTPARSIRTHREGDQNYLIVGGEGHKVGQEPDTIGRYQALMGWIQQTFGPREPLFKWSAQDYTSVDGVPYIGKLAPGLDHMWVATGFKKWGMTTGTAAGMILADRILGADNPWAEVFDSTRIKPVASASKLVKENLNVAKHFVSDHLERLSAPQIDALRPGQGAIVKVDGHSVAAYRDDQGAVHALSPVCTHLKCTVAFNPAEKTWDCPCHGSRFDIEGKVIQGPALKDLDVVQQDQAPKM